MFVLVSRHGVLVSATNGPTRKGKERTGCGDERRGMEVGRKKVKGQVRKERRKSTGLHLLHSAGRCESGTTLVIPNDDDIVDEHKSKQDEKENRQANK
ncbi:uncharacterized protein SPSK_10672 [Sporothrix schenckii 1099-18]|uniref:Uncharacterized protein n=1 Tax=Sporothrix schenckii 1099-18 TaxID=1397361 RepID=A0A0F2LSP2_SPOSC|nr:uncharacterized protein SPSK_10672 [Sporothrix schenckii 1099-18]KJR80503.1 hypothetical protein SPSK_10672 [Sporothrix schenckii 1099-18]